jgi:short-subunit dehydrogenase
MSTIALNNKKVLITGASSGIGRELAHCFARERTQLIIASLPSEKKALEEVAETLRREHAVQVQTLYEDLATADGPEKLYRQAVATTPGIDVLVNNAGVMAFGLFHQLSLESQEKIVAVNLRAYMLLMRLFLPDMIQRGTGYIFNVSSVSAFVPTPRHSVYGATKAFVQRDRKSVV